MSPSPLHYSEYSLKVMMFIKSQTAVQYQYKPHKDILVPGLI